ncbi:MAG: hypothetical protein KBS35_01615 [Mycoplasma sp.]|nr:hypothetical protein [Candidatus Hennigella equi]
MKVKEVNMILNTPKLQNQECSFKIVSKKKAPPEWFTTYMDNFRKEINARFDSIDHRIDNLVKLNNLKE